MTAGGRPVPLRRRGKKVSRVGWVEARSAEAQRAMARPQSLPICTLLLLLGFAWLSPTYARG